MQTMQRLNSFSQLKVMSDPRRLSILKLLLDAPATLSQLGKALVNISLVAITLRRLSRRGCGIEELKSGGFIEKYYRSKANAYLFQSCCCQKDLASNRGAFREHDLALEMLTETSYGELAVFTLPVGSLMVWWHFARECVSPPVATCTIPAV
jgi:DNA-binding transcriptional ArsR family regulator